MGTEQLKVELIDHMGNDLSPIRAAIVSNGYKATDKYTNSDGELTPAAHSLLNFLARGCTTGEWDAIKERLYSLDGEKGWEIKQMEDVLSHVKNMPAHWTPFGHTAITVYAKAPLFVARQLGKHQVGFVWNEISRRYVDKQPEFYRPDTWRGRSADKKQGSDASTEVNVTWYDRDDGYNSWPEDAYSMSIEAYQKMLELGVAPEQARMVLPQSMLTEWYWTGNLYSFANMFISRTDPHTQEETRVVSKMIGDVIKPLFPVSWEALVGG